MIFGGVELDEGRGINAPNLVIEAAHIHRSAIIEVHQTRLLAVVQVLPSPSAASETVPGSYSVRTRVSLFPTNELAHRQLANRHAMKVGLDDVEPLQRGSHELTCTKA